MCIFNRSEECPQFSRSLAGNLSGIRIHENSLLPAEIEGQGRGRVRSYGDGRSSLRPLDRCQQRVQRQALRSISRLRPKPVVRYRLITCCL